MSEFMDILVQRRWFEGGLSLPFNKSASQPVSQSLHACVLSCSCLRINPSVTKGIQAFFTYPVHQLRGLKAHFSVSLRHVLTVSRGRNLLLLFCWWFLYCSWSAGDVCTCYCRPPSLSQVFISLSLINAVCLLIFPRLPLRLIKSPHKNKRICCGAAHACKTHAYLHTYTPTPHMFT